MTLLLLRSCSWFISIIYLYVSICLCIICAAFLLAPNLLLQSHWSVSAGTAAVTFRIVEGEKTTSSLQYMMEVVIPLPMFMSHSSSPLMHLLIIDHHSLIFAGECYICLEIRDAKLTWYAGINEMYIGTAKSINRSISMYAYMQLNNFIFLNILSQVYRNVGRYQLFLPWTTSPVLSTQWVSWTKICGVL